MAEALPDSPVQELIIDHIHRLSKPQHLPHRLRRDTLVWIHFYHTKERLLALTRQADKVYTCLASLALYVDLSQYTHNSNATYLLSLNLQIPYQWEYLAKLIVTREGKNYFISSLDEGLNLLRKWIILDFSSQMHHSCVEPNWSWLITFMHSGVSTSTMPLWDSALCTLD